MRNSIAYINHPAGIGTCTLFCFLLFFSSCYTPRYVYSPAAQNVPLLAEKGDSKLGILYSTNLAGTKNIDGQTFSGYTNGIDVHSAYAISNKYAVQLNYFSRSEKNGGDFASYSDSSVLRYKRNLTEIGAGYYTNLGDNKKLLFQVFAGIGLGKFSFTDNGLDAGGAATLNFHQANITKFYIQPVLIYQNKKRTAVSVSSRFSIINYSKIKTDYSADQLDGYELTGLGRSPVVFWEPAFIHAFGFKQLPFFRLEYQLGFSVLMNRRFVDARSFNFSAGLQADIHNLLKKKAATSKKD